VKTAAAAWQRTTSLGTTLQLHLLVVIFAGTTILGRLATVSASVLVTWRCLLAALGALAWAGLVGRHRIVLPRAETGKLLGIGVLIGLHWLCLFGAVKVANVSIALAGLATLSLFTALTEPWLLGRRIRSFEIFLGMIVLAGIGLIAGWETQHLLGLGLALLSAFLAAVFLVLNRQIVIGGTSPMVMVAWEMAAAAVVSGVSIPLFDAEGYAAMVITNGADWLWILLLAMVCTVFAQAWTNHLLRSISAFTFNLTANFEPIYGIIAASLLFGEHQQVGPAFYGGTLLIACANLLHPLFQRKAS
jgi:drug/metabolite transporter (DMT)-like permease